MLSRYYPEAIEFLDGCTRRFLENEGRPGVMLACGQCALVGYNDDLGITTVVAGRCSEEAFHGSGDMMTSGSDAEQTYTSLI